MSDSFVEAFVDKLIILEQKVGANVRYDICPPFLGMIPDYLSLQKIAKEIACFAGLADYTFIVAKGKQKEKVAGHIDLSTNDNTVFIEIDDKMLDFPDAVYATLCHEVTHKWLQINSIKSPIDIQIDNEILTDIASVFLGFGKIMLNGCSNTNTTYEPITNGTQKITNTLRVGYIDRNQLAFVYGLVCAMRKIPLSDMIQGLKHEAAEAVHNRNSLYGHYYASHYHENEALQKSIDRFTICSDDTQYALCNINKHVTYIKQSFCESIESFVQAGHKQLKSLRNTVLKLSKDSSPDPVLRFLRAIKTEHEIARSIEKIHTLLKEADEIFLHTRKIGRRIAHSGHRFPTPSLEMFNIIICPQDGTKLRLPENSGDLIATCPTCKYRFSYNTNIVTFREELKPPKKSWWKNILTIKRSKK